MTLKLRCDQLRKVSAKLSTVLVGKINFKHFFKVFLRFCDRGLSFGIKYNIPIFVCLMSLLSCGKWTNAARYENYSV